MTRNRSYIFLLTISIVFINKALLGQENISVPLSKMNLPGKLDEQNDHYLKPVALIIPGTFLIYGGLKPFINGIQRLDDSIYSKIETNHPGFHTNADDYLTWAPSASIYLLDALKVKTEHSFKEHLILDAGSLLITGGLGYTLRLITRNSDAFTKHNTKFPSGHTANAFRGAEIFHQELKYSHPLLSYGGYLIATTVGILRIYNKDHLLTEVITGAGLGILSTKLTYWIFDRIKSRKR